MSLPTAPLWRGLIDDAAVFPPGNAPLDVAITRHFAHKTSPYAACIGALLVPVGVVDQLQALVHQGGVPLAVGLISRPGSDPDELTAAVEALDEDALIEIAGIERPWTPAWRDVTPIDAPLALEVGRDAHVQADALSDIAVALADGVEVVAKFRTGWTPTWAWPTEDELAAFIVGCQDEALPFKLTGGLHHLVRAEHPDPQHGLLNVILATRAALTGATVEAVSSVLAERDRESLVDAVAHISDAEAAALRECFTAYGCCEVTDPINELAEAGLLDLTNLFDVLTPSALPSNPTKD